jgi:AcrR family transcriptional regulator
MSRRGSGRLVGSAAFEALAAEKQRRIMDAAMAEFAEHGYESASTNRIAAGAGIGKGMVFHYFGSKQQLLLYCFRRALEEYNRFFYPRAEEELPAELFARTLRWQAIKIEYYRQQPLRGRFLTNTYLGSSGKTAALLEEAYREDFRIKREYFNRGLDCSSLRRGIEREKALELFFTALEGVERILIARHWRMDAPFPAERVQEELRDYLEILKGGLYGTA